MGKQQGGELKPTIRTTRESDASVPAHAKSQGIPCNTGAVHK